MYELLVGLPPYYANNREELFHNIENAVLRIPSYISTEARSLLKSVRYFGLLLLVTSEESC